MKQCFVTRGCVPTDSVFHSQSATIQTRAARERDLPDLSMGTTYKTSVVDESDTPDVSFGGIVDIRSTKTERTLCQNEQDLPVSDDVLHSQGTTFMTDVSDERDTPDVENFSFSGGLLERPTAPLTHSSGSFFEQIVLSGQTK